MEEHLQQLDGASPLQDCRQFVRSDDDRRVLDDPSAHHNEQQVVAEPGAAHDEHQSALNNGAHNEHQDGEVVAEPGAAHDEHQPALNNGAHNEHQDGEVVAEPGAAHDEHQPALNNGAHNEHQDGEVVAEPGAAHDEHQPALNNEAHNEHQDGEVVAEPGAAHIEHQPAVNPGAHNEQQTGQLGKGEVSEAEERTDLLTMDLNDIAFLSDDKMKSKKEALLAAEEKVSRLDFLGCIDPKFALAMLHKHAATLQELDLRGARLEHLQTALRMPQLRVLKIEDIDSSVVKGSGDLPREAFGPGPGLRTLWALPLPWPALVCVLSTHRNTLEALRVRLRLAGNADLDLDLPPPPASMPKVRELELWMDDFEQDAVEDPPGQELQALVMRNCWLSLLSSARHSLEELTLHHVRGWEVLQAAQGLPSLRKLFLYSCHHDFRNAPALTLVEQGQQCRLRELEAYGDVPRQPVLALLAAYRHSLEEVSLHMAHPELLEAVQGLPMLRKLSIDGSGAGDDQAFAEHPDIPLVNGAPAAVRVLSFGYSFPPGSVISILRIYSGTLEELELGFVTRDQLGVIRNNELPRLRRLKLTGYASDSDDDLKIFLASSSDAAPLLLEKLEVCSVPSCITAWLIMAVCRTSLRELNVESGNADVMLEAQRLPLLEKLTISSLNSWVPGGTEDDPSPPPPRRLAHGGGVRVLNLGELPRQSVQSFLLSHKHSLEEVQVSCVSREHLLAVLHMPRLKRLSLRQAAHDLQLAAALPEVAVGEGVQRLRLGQPMDVWHSAAMLPLETVRCLLTAYRGSLRYLELDVFIPDEVVRAGPGGRDVWPFVWRGLPDLLEQSGLEQLDTLKLIRPTYLVRCGDQCRRQLAALRHVLPGTVVLCALCNSSESEWPNCFD